jgi:hypothetical protein
MIKSSIPFPRAYMLRYNTGQTSFLNVIMRPNLAEPSALHHLDSSSHSQITTNSLTLVAITAVRYPLKNVIISLILPSVLNPVELSPVGDVLKPALDRLSSIVSREGGPIFNLEAISSEVK